MLATASIATSPETAEAAFLMRGKVPAGIAVNEVTNKTYVAYPSSNSVAIIDGVTNSVTSIGVGLRPTAVAVDTRANRIFVANYGSGTLSIIDGTTYYVRTVPVGDSPTGVTVNEATGVAYVSHSEEDDSRHAISAVSGATGAVQTMSFRGLSYLAPVVNELTGRLYALSSEYSDEGGTRNFLEVIDCSSNQVVARVALPSASYPAAIAVDTRARQVYVLVLDSGLSVVDESTLGALTIELPVAASEAQYFVAANERTARVYVTTMGDFATPDDGFGVYELDGSTLRVLRRFASEPLTGLAVDEGRNIVLMTTTNGTLRVYDTVTGATRTSSMPSYKWTPAGVRVNERLGLAYASIGYNYAYDSGGEGYVPSWRESVFVTPVDSMLNRIELSLPLATKQTLTILGGSGSAIWSSANPAIASVNSDGVVTGRKAGWTEIKAVRGGASMTSQVVVTNPRLSRTKTSLRRGARQTLKVTGGSGVIRWSSTNRAVATVGSTGVVTGRGRGTATIVAVRNGVRMTCKVTVTN
ncbi:MAG: Ig-like domain-containing protein [Coriobacteriia bacterium]|nr:Ig-like domain-containing protein [Coriobacteriia bacterium]